MTANTNHNESPSSPSEAHSDSAKGAYKIWPANEVGEPIGLPSSLQEQEEARPVLTDEIATDIYFGVVDTAPHPIPKDQRELQQHVAQILHTVRKIYLQPTTDDPSPRKAQFRSYYVRLFRLAQLGLEGERVSPETAQSALNDIETDLVNEEAGRVKNSHLKRLGKTAIMMALPFALLYLVARLTPANGWLAALLVLIGIDRTVFANFMLLWIGCFIGVWLSYGIRTSKFTIDDLTVTDSDRLQPVVRLLFAGTLTMILGIAFTLDVVQVSIGNFSLTDFASRPMLAFLIGAFCGISELLLPNMVSKQARDFVKDTE